MSGRRDALARPVARIVWLAASLSLASCGGAPPQVSSEATLARVDVRAVKGTIFVSPAAQRRTYQKVAVMPFRAPAELVGASVSDLFATEILRTYKYDLVERSQMEQVLGEQALGLRGVTDSAAAAVRVGKLLGVQGVIVGTVPEYGAKASGGAELVAMGINVRMLDVNDGSIVWSISDSAVSDQPTSQSAFAKRLVQDLVARLVQEWVRAGDFTAMNMPAPQVVSAQGKIRGTTLEILAAPVDAVASYRILRGTSPNGPFQPLRNFENVAGRTVKIEDDQLQDARSYYYQVSAVGRSGLVSPPAGLIEVTTVGPPRAVEGLDAQSGLIRNVVLRWRPSSDANVKAYRIDRRPPGGAWAPVTTLNGQSQVTFTDQALEDDKTYGYRLVAVNVVGVESPPSAMISATTKGAPSPVRELSATSRQPRQVSLSWQPVNEPEVKGYEILRAAKATGPLEVISFVDGRTRTTFVDMGRRGGFGGGPGLEDGTPYFYRVRVVNVVDVRSAASPVAEAVTKPVPEAVAGLKTSSGEVKQVTLVWRPSPETDVVKYEVSRGSDPGQIKPVSEVPAGTTRLADRGLKDGATYHYRVRAVDRDGLPGTLSVPVSASTKPLPGKPTGLQARVENSQIVLVWTANIEPDIAKYVVAQKGFLSWNPVGEVPGAPFLFQGEVKKGKTLTFRVLAVDQTRLESEPSDEVTVTIP